MIAWIIIGVLFVITWIVFGVLVSNLNDREKEAQKRLDVHRSALDRTQRELGINGLSSGEWSLRDQLATLKDKTDTRIATLLDYLGVEEKNDPPKTYLVKRKGKK